MILLAGIDPGLRGAITLAHPAVDNNTIEIVSIDDMPIFEFKRSGKMRRSIDIQGIIRILSERTIGHAFIELAGSRVGEGVVSSGTTWRGYGRLEGVLATLGIPYTEKAASVWKKTLQVPSDKKAARARASQLLPADAHRWPLVKHDGRAESAMICLYGSRWLNGIMRG
jgi:hypothetical protein